MGEWRETETEKGGEREKKRKWGRGGEAEREKSESSLYFDEFSIQSFWDHRQPPECSDAILIGFFFISSC